MVILSWIVKTISVIMIILSFLVMIFEFVLAYHYSSKMITKTGMQRFCAAFAIMIIGILLFLGMGG